MGTDQQVILAAVTGGQQYLDFNNESSRRPWGSLSILLPTNDKLLAATDSGPAITNPANSKSLEKNMAPGYGLMMLRPGLGGVPQSIHGAPFSHISSSAPELFT